MQAFTSEIFIIDINPYVPVPDSIVKYLLDSSKKTSGPIPVKGTLHGKPYTQTVVKYAGMWRLYLNGPMRDAAGIDVGDVAHIEIEYDERPRVEEMPKELAKILSKDTSAKEAFELLPKYRQKEILRYLNNLKSEETRRRNIGKVINYLRGGKEDLIVLTYDRSRKKPL